MNIIKKIKFELFSIVLIIFFGTIELKAQQSICVKLTNGLTDKIPIEQVQKIKFSATNMILHKTDATTLTWEIEDVEKYYYASTTQVDDIYTNPDFNVLVYPNPTSEQFIIDYQITKTSKINIILTDITGKIIDVLLSEKKTQGKYSLQWQNHNLQAGTYLIKVFSENNSTLKKIIILK